jgi:hypothetical protein
LLYEYEDTFHDDVPCGLDPFREIKHLIDLVSRAVIPNRPAYKSSLENTNELQRQVKELMTKGYIRKSMNPCAVTMFLMPKKDGSWMMYELLGYQQHYKNVLTSNS